MVYGIVYVRCGKLWYGQKEFGAIRETQNASRKTNSVSGMRETEWSPCQGPEAEFGVIVNRSDHYPIVCWIVDPPVV